MVAWKLPEAPSKKMRVAAQNRKKNEENAQRLNDALDRIAPPPSASNQDQHSKPISNFDRILKKLRKGDKDQMTVDAQTPASTLEPPPRCVQTDARRILKRARKTTDTHDEFGVTDAADAALFEQLDEEVINAPLCDPNFWRGAALQGHEVASSSFAKTKRNIDLSSNAIEDFPAKFLAVDSETRSVHNIGPTLAVLARIGNDNTESEGNGAQGGGNGNEQSQVQPPCPTDDGLDTCSDHSDSGSDGQSGVSDYQRPAKKAKW